MVLHMHQQSTGALNLQHLNNEFVSKSDYRKSKFRIWEKGSLCAICKQYLRVKNNVRVIICANTEYCGIGDCRVCPTVWPTCKAIVHPKHRSKDWILGHPRLTMVYTGYCGKRNTGSTQWRTQKSWNLPLLCKNEDTIVMHWAIVTTCLAVCVSTPAALVTLQ